MSSSTATYNDSHCEQPSSQSCGGAWGPEQGQGRIQSRLHAPSHSLSLLALYFQFNFPSPSSGSEPLTHNGSPPKSSAGEKDLLLSPRPLRERSRIARVRGSSLLESNRSKIATLYPSPQPSPARGEGAKSLRFLTHHSSPFTHHDPAARSNAQ
jgi:hypothetical protein